MSAAITAITMPKWGLTMTEGKVVQWLKQPGASFAPGEELLEIETSKITNVVEADAPGTLARIVAPEGTTLPIGALLAVIAPSDTPAARDRRVRRAVCRRRTNRSGGGCGTGGAARSSGARAARCAVWSWAAATACRCCCCTASAAISTRWMFNQPALCDGRRTLALDLPGHGLSSKDVGDGRRDAVHRRDRGRMDSARHGTRASRRAFDGRRDGHRIGGAASGAHRDPDAAGAGRPGPGDQRRVHRRLRARVAAQGGGGGAAIPGARPVADQSRDGRGVPALQATRRRCAGAGDDRQCLVPAGATGGRSGRDAACAEDAGAGDLGTRRPDHPGRPCRRGRISGTGACAGWRRAICRTWKRPAR